MPEEHDIWYAVSVTRVVLPPKQTLETFGATTVRYHLISELVDEVDRVRIRTGKVYSERPQIITPNHFADQLLEGFGDKAQEYAGWLRSHNEMVKILQYGLQFRKEHASAETVSQPLKEVAEKVKASVEADNEPLSAVLVGADELWEVSLLKFLRDYIEQSAPNNLRDFQQRDHEDNLEFERGLEMEFRQAAGDPNRIQALGQKLQRHGLFEKYEDRFYALINR